MEKERMGTWHRAKKCLRTFTQRHNKEKHGATYVLQQPVLEARACSQYKEGGWVGSTKDENMLLAANSQEEDAASTNAAAIWDCTSNTSFWADSALHCPVAACAHGRHYGLAGYLRDEKQPKNQACSTHPAGAVVIAHGRKNGEEECSCTALRSE